MVKIEYWTKGDKFKVITCKKSEVVGILLKKLRQNIECKVWNGDKLIGYVGYDQKPVIRKWYWWYDKKEIVG